MAKNKDFTVADESERKYRAPALEKGLDILELLAREGIAMTTSQIAANLDRSVSELFRMVLTLEARGYIAQTDDRDGYALTNKLFSLGMAQVPTKTLVEIAMPVMKELARQISQSCHLVVASSTQVVVVARIENPRDMGFSVRVGYRRRVVESTSGQILFGHQPEEVQGAWLPQLEVDAAPGELDEFLRKAQAAVERGHVRSPSDFAIGVTDLSAPVLGRQGAVASLTVPFVEFTPVLCDLEAAIPLLKKAAAKISTLLGEEVG